ncbi:hypothetical protein E0H86_00880 [Acinetobacter sp. ANC 4635]|uniref:hypothetical protein n=1 Tax=Acinetobacter sp. ANC 4635 TaxID=2529846 RepID=UPI00103EEBDD|nr:hypothetical protein [Acinetobacter sp. ANC 4635]TCB33228.1 hypothetical protein E0H86_00880 [Acinetobacter sp. ANC 4635]
MIKKILATLTIIFVLIYGLVIFYWRDVQYDPSAQDFVLYLLVLPVTLALLLLSPWLIYRGYRAYQDKQAALEQHKQQQVLQQQQQAEQAALPQKAETQWQTLQVYSAHAWSALGEDQSIIEALQEFRCAELDKELCNAHSLPILSYRIHDLDQPVTAQQDDEQFSWLSIRQQRIQALVQQQLEQHSAVLWQIAEHIQQSTLFYEGKQSTEYRMHPAWINPNAESTDSSSEVLAPQAVSRLDGLHLHLLLPDNLALTWDRQQSEKALISAFQSLGFEPHQFKLDYHFVDADQAYSKTVQQLQQAAQSPTWVTLLLVADSEIDQDYLDEQTWQQQQYIPAEFVASCCVAASTLKIQDLEATQFLSIASQQPDLNEVLMQTAWVDLPQYEAEQPFVLLLDDMKQVKVVKQAEQYFVNTPIQQQHYLLQYDSIGSSQTLAGAYGVLLGLQVQAESMALVTNLKHSSTHILLHPDALNLTQTA